jgi:hypothetical protein
MELSSADFPIANNGADLTPEQTIRQQALMERILERKLDALHADYLATLAAEPDSTVATNNNDVAVAAKSAAAAEENGIDPYQYNELDENNSSQAWTDFKSQLDFEAEAESSESEEDKNSAEEEEESSASNNATARSIVPLSDSEVARIKSLMSGIKVSPPGWAKGLHETQWSQMILQRIPATNTVSNNSRNDSNAAENNTNSNHIQSGNTTMAAAKKRAKKKRQQAKKKAAANNSNSNINEFEAFEATFPPTAEQSSLSP